VGRSHCSSRFMGNSFAGRQVLFHRPRWLSRRYEIVSRFQQNLTAPDDISSSRRKKDKNSLRRCQVSGESADYLLRGRAARWPPDPQNATSRRRPGHEDLFGTLVDLPETATTQEPARETPATSSKSVDPGSAGRPA